ncbi:MULTISPECIES: DNA adenine methylase [Bacillales]|uniref:DNA adenine methylase n=1 Tax=Bacillales TaxID=1385 RepID=UPI00034AF862|nr:MULTISPECIES: DNA adenine methylase [Bacillales]KMZ43538.1 hypothetical protein AC624_22060 [Bacillus sp. FJAT-27238]
MILNYDQNVPHIIKYMGSKRKMLDQVITAIGSVHTSENTPVCDLFAGSSVLSGALRNSLPMISNDIQQYSGVLAKAYLGDYHWDQYPNITQKIVDRATEHVNAFRRDYPQYQFQYSQKMSRQEFVELEQAQQALINADFQETPYHLYTKYYSGTYWSFDQCLWIDALREAIDYYRVEYSSVYYGALASLMFAMSYTSQSTGHYAQYREANTDSSMKDILIYREKELVPYFVRKMEDFQQTLEPNNFNHQVFAEDYMDCLDHVPIGTTIYADPPYCFVHYSRFYHAIETLVRYDYPTVRYKGRYRIDRHQSPFCIRTQVRDAFERMFHKIRDIEGQLVLSYSNTGMISLPDLLDLAAESFGQVYNIEPSYFEYIHSTMGRKEDKSREVNEAIIVVRRV